MGLSVVIAAATEPALVIQRRGSVTLNTAARAAASSLGQTGNPTVRFHFSRPATRSAVSMVSVTEAEALGSGSRLSNRLVFRGLAPLKDAGRGGGASTSQPGRPRCPNPWRSRGWTQYRHRG